MVSITRKPYGAVDMAKGISAIARFMVSIIKKYSSAYGFDPDTNNGRGNGHVHSTDVHTVIGSSSSSDKKDKQKHYRHRAPKPWFARHSAMQEAKHNLHRATNRISTLSPSIARYDSFSVSHASGQRAPLSVYIYICLCTHTCTLFMHMYIHVAHMCKYDPLCFGVLVVRRAFEVWRSKAKSPESAFRLSSRKPGNLMARFDRL